jgi:hypothetical protein
METSPVNAQNGWQVAAHVFGTGQIELQMLIRRIGEFDLPLKENVIRNHQVSTVSDGHASEDA